MNNIKIISSLVLLSLTLNAFSQSKELKTETSKDGKSIVKYELTKEDNGTRFYYDAETTVDTPQEELDAYLSNSSNHKNFLERTPKSEEIERISENEWITYYFFNAPWPMSDSDVVVKFERKIEGSKIILTATAVPNDFKPKDVRRLTDYKVIYELDKVNEESTVIKLTADYIPGGSVPKFLINRWFPNGPANIVSNIGEKR